MKNGSGTKTSTTGWMRALHGALLLAIIAGFVIQAPIAATADPSPTGATISSDLADYNPGQQVTLTGSGWSDSESVHIVVNDTINQTWNHTVDVTAASDGSLVDVFTLPTYFVSDYDVTATGPTSGTATTTFTDSNLPSSVQLLNWQTKNGGGWVTATLGTNNSDYKEGETVPFQLDLGNLGTSNNPYWAPVCRDYANSATGPYGYTTLNPFDSSRPATAGGTVSDTFGAFTGVGIDITGVQDLLASSGSAFGSGTFSCGSTQRLVIVQFNVTGTGTKYLLWGGRLSAPGDTDPFIAFGNSSSNYPGGSLQMRLASPDKTAGINPGAITQLARIVVTKVVDSGTATPDQWCFTATGPNSYSSTECIASGQSSVEFLALDTGSYTVTESSVNGYTFASGSGTNCTFSGSTATASVIAAVGGATSASCTFHNARDLGSLKLSKHLTGGPSSGYNPDYTIHYDCGTGFIDNVSVKAGASQTINNIPTGTVCTVTEPTLPPPPTDYTFGPVSFTDSSGTANDGIVTIVKNTTVEVQTNNILTSTANENVLKLSKVLSGGPEGYDGPFTIHYSCTDGSSGDVVVNAGDFKTVNGFPSGTVCTVTEPTLPDPPEGYSFGSVTFTDTSGTANDGIVTIVGSQTVEVATNNAITRDLGNFKITKTTSNPDGATLPAAFTGTYNCGTGYTGNFSVANGGSQTVSGIPTGNTCSVVETAPANITGYTWGAATYTPSTIVISTKGGTFEIVVGNSITRDLGNFKITKTTSNPDGATLPAAFTGTYNCGTGYTGNFSVANGGSQTISGIPTGNTCSVVETAPANITGYTWGAATYTPSTIVISTKGGTFEIVVGNSITRDTGSFKITKFVINPDGATLPAAFTGTYDCGTGYTGNFSVANGGSQTVSGIPTGNTCSVVETAPANITGYTWGAISYTPDTIEISTKGGTFEIVVGNSITRDLGNFKITKTTSNPDGATLPAAFTGTYNCGTGYTGNFSVANGGSQTISGIPTGNTCSVVETAPANITGYTWGAATYTPSTIVISTKGGTFEIVVGNSITRDTGSFKITKFVINPDGATLPAAFTGTYDCGTGYTGNFSVADGASQTVSGIPTGNTCSVVETAPANITGYTWGAISYTPDTIEISTKGGTFEIVVGNSITRDLGNFKITKTTSNPDGATLPAAFTGTYNCGTGYTGNFSVANGGSQTVSGIPTGNTCSVVETAPANITGYTWGAATYTPSTIVISTKGGTFEIVVGNSITRDTGSFKITKTTSNPDGATLPAAFTGTYNCGTGYTGNFSVANGGSQTISGIPTGNTCSVVETAPANITGYTWGAATYTPSTIVISTKGGTFEIVVGNSITRDTGSFKITKTTSNPDGATLPAAFTGTYNCGTGYTGNFSVANGGSQTVSGIPTGNTCSVVETAPANITGYTWGAATYTPSTIVISTKGGTFEIVVGNSITRDLGNFKITKTTSNPDGATLPAAFTGTYNCGTGYTGNFSVANGGSQTISGIPTGNTCSVVETAPANITGYTWGAATYTPSTIVISTKGGTFEIVVGNSITRDRGTIIIIKNAQPQEGQFAFTTTPSSYNGFSLTGATTGNPPGNVNSQTLPTGNYTVSETTQLGWLLTGIGGGLPVNPNDPFNTQFYCTVTVVGSGTSFGIGDLNTASAAITLGKNDTVTCTFENTGNGATRTQGFWATHTPLAEIAWFGGTYGTKVVHTFPGVALTTGILDRTFCSTKIGYNGTTVGKNVDTLAKLMGGFWSDISKKTAGNPIKRTALDQARMQLLQQLLAAELNASAFGGIPSGGTAMFASWESAYCGTSQTAISTAMGQAASFNSRGDSSTFTPGTSADSKNARAIADKAFWDILP